jgi:hypothetical protein
VAVIGAPDMKALIHKRFLRNERPAMRARGPLRPARRGRADRDETFVRRLDAGCLGSLGMASLHSALSLCGTVDF